MDSDESIQSNTETELKAAETVEEFQKQQNLVLAIAGGVLATLISALTWALVTVAMEY
jgi:uncharacterized protein (DUF697 family)